MALMDGGCALFRVRGLLQGVGVACMVVGIGECRHNLAAYIQLVDCPPPRWRGCVFPIGLLQVV